MLATSRILASLIETQIRTESGTERDCRLLVPGLTQRIAREMHGYLLQKGMPSFLIVGSEEVPDERGRLIRAVGLTSKRIGSFVAVACPGQLTNIQDSVRGSGGAIRSISFSEEWPWIDSGNERYRFDGPVLDAFAGAWTDDKRDQEWLKDFVRSGVLESTRSSPRRSEILLEDILGKFDPRKIEGLDNVRHKMLFHSGVAKPSAIIVPAKTLIKESVRLSNLIVARCQEENEIRRQALETIAELFPADEEAMAICLEKFLDAVGSTASLDLGLLSFFGCWGNDPAKADTWNSLTADRLADIFEVRERERSECSYKVTCSRGFVSRNGKRLASFVGEEVTVAISFKIPEREFGSGSCFARVVSRKKVLGKSLLESREGFVSISFKTADCSKRQGGSLPLRVEIVSGDEQLVDEKLKMELCGSDRPAFLLISPNFEAFDAHPVRDTEPPDRKLLVEEPVDVLIFGAEGLQATLKDEDEEDLELEQVADGIQRTTHKVDVAGDARGRAVVTAEIAGLSAVVSLEASDLEKGEFTVEDELRVVLCGTRDKRLEELIQLFEGNRRDAYPALGGVDAAARRRTTIAEAVSVEHGWRPVLANLLQPVETEPRPLGSLFLQIGEQAIGGLATATLSPRAMELLESYTRARQKAVSELKHNLDVGESASDHPVYASHPTFVEARSDWTEQILASYLEAYGNILAFAETSRGTLEWSELFVLLHLDCVVHWDDTPRSGCFFLIGPWHPLILGKRFMVQKALLDRAHRLQRDKGRSGKMFRHLTTLLGKVQSFRWFASLSSDDRQLEPAYVAATSDPGWHVALKTYGSSIAAVEEGGGMLKIGACLRQFLGLRVDLAEGAAGGLAAAVVTSYIRSFPSRRSVGMRVRRGYSSADVVESVDSILHAEGGMSSQLPGGIRLYLEEALEQEVHARWADPPLQVYKYEKDRDLLEATFPDIYLLPPSAKRSFISSETNCSMPRGTGSSSVFCVPLQWLTEGQSQVPKSITCEIDQTGPDEGGLGGAYRKVLGETSRSFGSGLAAVASVDLPVKLGASWVVVPGYSVDPAIMVKYVRDGIDRDLEKRALWDYRYDLAGQAKSFFVLSMISKGFQVAVNGFFGGKDVAKAFISELGKIGIAIGGEALRSGRHALGVVGLVGAVRLMIGTGSNHDAPLSERSGSIGFLLPVDAFSSFFGKNGDLASLRADLLAVSVAFAPRDSRAIRISAWGVESKFVTGTFSAARAREALDQARATEGEFRDLVRTSLRDGGTPERLAILELVRFGLRITSPSRAEDIGGWIESERRIYQAILDGSYEYAESLRKGVVVSTEGDLSGVAEQRLLGDGIWVRLTRSHWPEVAETPQVRKIREELLKTLGVAEDTAVTGVPSIEVPAAEIPPVDAYPQASTPTDETADTRGKEGSGPLRGILVGVDNARHRVILDPQSTSDPLDNLNIMISGSSGTGKTQFLKYLVCKFREQKKNVFLLDFKNDFAGDQRFCELAGLQRVYVNFSGLPYNPLIPYPIRHKETDELFLQCGHYIAGVTSVLRSTYGLGVQQQTAVKKAIIEAFDELGVPTTGTIPFSNEFRFPDLSVVGRILEETYPSAYSRLDPLFTLNLFQEEFRSRSFQTLVGKSYILDLSQIPSDEIKNALAQLIVLSAHSYYNTQPHSGDVRQLLVFDEAHRVMASDFMLRLARECRAYGVGTLLSSQYPTDFPAEISASMATKIMHGNGPDSERVKAIAQMLGLVGREAEIAGLGRFEAILYNRHSPGQVIRTLNFPVYLLWSMLTETNKATMKELSEVSGIDTAKLPIKNLMGELESLGLAEERSDGIYCLPSG